MSDVITGLRQVIQDLVAPELKSHGVKLENLQKQLESMQKQIDTGSKHNEMQFQSMAKTLDAFRAELRAEFASLRMNNQMEVLREVSPLSGRLAVVESRLDQR